MSYKTDRYDIKKLPNQSLAVTQCGLQICNSGHSCGPCLYEHYSSFYPERVHIPAAERRTRSVQVRDL